MDKGLSAHGGKSEYEEQVTVFSWIDMMKIQKPELRLAHASLNGARLTIGQAVKMKKAGMRAGVPDILIPIKRGPHSGLFIELKRIGGKKPDPKQEEWLKALSEQGFDCKCCFGSEAAIRCIESYLNG
jgi:hypothetical protein